MSQARIDLAGPWLIRADPGDAGARERWWDRPPTDGWREIQVPGAWQDVLGQDFHGIAWYRRTAHVPPDWLTEGSRLWLRFESVATDCLAWVNGVEVGRHVGDYLPFQFEVTGALRASGNPDRKGEARDARPIDIIVRVNEIPAPRPAPGILTESGHITKGFHDVLSLHHGGIWGDVSLVRTGRTTPVPNGVAVWGDPYTGLVRVRMELEFPAEAEVVALAVEEPGGNPCAGGIFELAAGKKVFEWELAIGEADFPPEGADDVEPRSLKGMKALVKLAGIGGALPWGVGGPLLYTAEVALFPDGLADEPSEEQTLRFGFRTVTTGGPHNSQILLNGQPILLRGILHWGHEPAHGSPAPTPDEVRGEFTRLKALGFNLVCLCMVYMPEYFYDIADEMGMLIWQEHPVWKSRMEDELIPEYQRLFEGFFRRDRRHPSVILVSGACEHECFNPALAKWWWETARRELPNTLVQVQTAFLAWTNPAQTDLHDEHTYENSGRFAAYLNDVNEEIGRIGPKPFIMGETIIGTSWIDAAGVRQRFLAEEGWGRDAKAVTQRDQRNQRDSEEGGNAGPPGCSASASSLSSSDSSGHSEFSSSSSPASRVPWWSPKGLAECEAFEEKVLSRFGRSVLEQFKRDADRFNLDIRRFQSELFRSHQRNAGWVMNHIRDVPQCRCGFKDDAERWRFTPEQTLPWLGDAAVLLSTPEHRRGFAGGRTLAARIGLSTFSDRAFDGVPDVSILRAGKPERVEVGPLRARPGDVSFANFTLVLPRVDRPTPLPIHAAAGNLASNTWNLWLFPGVLDAPADVVRLDGLPFSERDHRMDWDERAYSSGWGLKVQSWKPILPDLSQLLFRCPLWRFDAPMPLGTRVVVTHKLTRRLIQFMEAGGRVVLLASKTAGGMDARTIMLWGQCPLVIENGRLDAGTVNLDRQEGAPRGILGTGDSEWILDLLHHDLTRRHSRAIPVDELGIADQVDPVIRLVFTHDSGAPKLFDAVFKTRIGKGMLIASSLDHSEDAGRYLLHRLIGYALSDDAACQARIDPAILGRQAAESH
jgi:hypothetical protein